MLLRVSKLTRNLRNNLENLKVSLGLRSIVDSAKTPAEAKKIYDWSLRGSRLRAAAMKKRLVLIIDSWESNTENDCHEHITFDEMEFLRDIVIEELNDVELDFLLYVDVTINACDVCNRRYMFFIDSNPFFVPLASRVISWKVST